MKADTTGRYDQGHFVSASRPDTTPRYAISHRSTDRTVETKRNALTQPIRPPDTNNPITPIRIGVSTRWKRGPRYGPMRTPALASRTFPRCASVDRGARHDLIRSYDYSITGPPRRLGGGRGATLIYWILSQSSGRLFSKNSC